MNEILLRHLIFLQGGTIYGYDGVKKLFLSGRGRVSNKSQRHYRAGFIERMYIVTEIPYQVNKAEMIMKQLN